jgi:hypothetical protein
MKHMSYVSHIYILTCPYEKIKEKEEIQTNNFRFMRRDTQSCHILIRVDVNHHAYGSIIYINCMRVSFVVIFKTNKFI